MAELDLDARRAEANLEDHKVTLGGVVYSLPAELPLLFVDRLQHDMVGAINLLFGEDDGPTVAPLLTDTDLQSIAQDLYGIEDGAGESSASPVSSNRAGRRAKPTSVGSTGSTSGKSVSARRHLASGD